MKLRPNHSDCNKTQRFLLFICTGKPVLLGVIPTLCNDCKRRWVFNFVKKHHINMRREEDVIENCYVKLASFTGYLPEHCFCLCSMVKNIFLWLSWKEDARLRHQSSHVTKSFFYCCQLNKTMISPLHFFRYEGQPIKISRLLWNCCPWN